VKALPHQIPRPAPTISWDGFRYRIFAGILLRMIASLEIPRKVSFSESLDARE
jgi:hypothetical protein